MHYCTDLSDPNDDYSFLLFLRDESDPDDAAKLPTALLALVEWLVYVQVNAIKQLSFGRFL